MKKVSLRKKSVIKQALDNKVAKKQIQLTKKKPVPKVVENVVVKPKTKKKVNTKEVKSTKNDTKSKAKSNKLVSKEKKVNYIQTDNLYLDPKKFIRLLEIKYNCIIYIFSLTKPITRHDKIKEIPKLIIPNHHPHTNYYTYDHKKISQIILDQANILDGNINEFIRKYLLLNMENK